MGEATLLLHNVRALAARFAPVLKIEGDPSPVFASFARPVLHAESRGQSRIEPHLVARSSEKKLLNPIIQGFGIQFHDFESTLRVKILNCQLAGGVSKLLQLLPKTARSLPVRSPVENWT